MSEVKTVVLGDFSKREFDYLNALIVDHLADMDINPASFAFHLEVDYTEEESEKQDEFKKKWIKYGLDYPTAIARAQIELGDTFEEEPNGTD
jgi:hypothetical protein